MMSKVESTVRTCFSADHESRLSWNTGHPHENSREDESIDIRNESPDADQTAASHGLDASSPTRHSTRDIMLTWIWSRASAWVYTVWRKMQRNYQTVVAACRVVNLVISCRCSIGSNIGACESPSSGSWQSSMGIPPLECARVR